MLKMSKEEIDKYKTIRGGWTKAQLAKWGIKWPPKSGWKSALENGLDLEESEDQ